MRRRSACGILFAVVVLATGCSDGLGDAAGTFEPAKPETLTVVTQPLPTAGFWEGTGNRPTGGLEFELAQELAESLGLERVEIRTEDFSTIVSGDLGDADLALALITPTTKRDEVLDFTTPYLRAAPALVVRSGTEVPDVKTAQELRWVVGANTTFVDIVAEVIRPDAEAVPIEDRGRELDAVRAGRADVAMFDLPAALAIARADRRLAVAAKLSETEPIAAALPEGSPNVEAVSTALRGLEADGTIDRLSERWLGSSISDGRDDVPLLRTTQ